MERNWKKVSESGKRERVQFRRLLKELLARFSRSMDTTGEWKMDPLMENGQKREVGERREKGEAEVESENSEKMCEREIKHKQTMLMAGYVYIHEMV